MRNKPGYDIVPNESEPRDMACMQVDGFRI